ncbi:MAG: hypothetical protein ACTS44_00580 [Candidatus Hodgkinia cicadicola]
MIARGFASFGRFMWKNLAWKRGAQTANRFGTTLPTFAGDLLALLEKRGLLSLIDPSEGFPCEGWGFLVN